MKKDLYKPIEGTETNIFAKEYHAQAQMHARWIRKKSYSQRTLNEIKRINRSTLGDYINDTSKDVSENNKNQIIKKPTMTIRDALILLQKIRYYDENGNIVTLMDEHEESAYLGKIFDKYSGTPHQIVRKMRYASTLESMGLIRINTENKENTDYIDPSSIHQPLIKIKKRKKQLKY